MKQQITKKNISEDVYTKEDTPSKQDLLEWLDPLRKITSERTKICNDPIDTIIDNFKTFDNRVNQDRFKEQSLKEIITDLQETTEKNVFTTLGTDFIFSKITPDVKSIFENRDPLKYFQKKCTIASFLDYELRHDLPHNTGYTSIKNIFKYE